MTADHVLVYRNAELAVIVAKAWGEALTKGVTQAKNYAGKLAIRFAYASNSQGVSASTKEGTEGKVVSYPTRRAVEPYLCGGERLA